MAPPASHNCPQCGQLRGGSGDRKWGQKQTAGISFRVTFPESLETRRKSRGHTGDIQGFLLRCHTVPAGAPLRNCGAENKIGFQPDSQVVTFLIIDAWPYGYWVHIVIWCVADRRRHDVRLHEGPAHKVLPGAGTSKSPARIGAGIQMICCFHRLHLMPTERYRAKTNILTMTSRGNWHPHILKLMKRVLYQATPLRMFMTKMAMSLRKYGTKMEYLALGKMECIMRKINLFTKHVSIIMGRCCQRRINNMMKTVI